MPQACHPKQGHGMRDGHPLHPYPHFPPPRASGWVRFRRWNGGPRSGGRQRWMTGRNWGPWEKVNHPRGTGLMEETGVLDQLQHLALDGSPKGGEGHSRHGQPAVDDLRVGGQPEILRVLGLQLQLLLLVQRDQVVHDAQGDRLRVVDGLVGGLHQSGHGLDDGTGQVVEERSVQAQSRNPLPLLDPALLRQLTVLHVDLLQGLDVLLHEADGHDHQLVGPRCPHLPQLVVGVGLEPLDGPDTALVGHDVVVGVPPLPHELHDEPHAGLHLLLVGVPQLLDVLLGHPVGREEDGGGRGAVELVAGPGDLIRHCVDVALPAEPGGDDTNLHLGEVRVGVEVLLEQPEGAAGGADGELGVQREDDELLDAVSLHLLDGGAGEGLPVAHRHVRLGLDALLGQDTLNGLALGDGGPQLGAAAADGLVPLNGGLGPELGDDHGQRLVEPLCVSRQGQDLWIGEEVVQERLHVFELIRPTEVQ
mmetsp:Transcript_153260/g.267780  ORF Transcript_153260/g.267780 Transcript_153260/m.267780 type:complete len:477 (+) Transcript_153260:543-1973(+)